MTMDAGRTPEPGSTGTSSAVSPAACGSGELAGAASDLDGRFGAARRHRSDGPGASQGVGPGRGTAPRPPFRSLLSRGSHAPGAGFSISEAVAYAAGEAWTQRPWCLSPVINEWLLVWNDSLDDEPRQQLLPYVERLGRSRGTTADEVVRQWAVIDWVVRVLAPLWLDAAGLSAIGRKLAHGRPVEDQATLSAAAPGVEAAWRATHRVRDRLFLTLAASGQPPGPSPSQRPPWRPAPDDVGHRQAEAWHSLADGTRAAVEVHRTLLGPAGAALGYRGERPEQCPVTWTAAIEAVSGANTIVAWRASHQLVSGDNWSWRIPGDSAWQLAYEFARKALEPAEETTHASAHRLLDHLLKVTETAS
jgi:hypothetical protein